ncbi:AAA family ATPase [Halorarius halobius]|uniref:AAA family ATPase n=1 Tax=Halorarius halobius TaxID=2962671 RepID=UPI0020CCD119|nr:AAA family ATPase [Halorarius halobius]
MHFKSLTLEGIRSYEQETVEFETGENLIFGPNGAGKSTILQGLFGGLFQTNITKKEVNNDFNLAELVRKQAESGRIELAFVIGGEEFSVEWEIKKQFDDEGVVTGAKTKSGYPKLSSPALDESISGFNDVQDEIQRIIGMDAKSFVNSVYVQQGDITRLIHADTETRREILDGLLGLDRMDELIGRVDKARKEYGKAERDAKTRLDDTQKRIDDLPETSTLDEKIQDLRAEESELDGEIEELDEKIDRLEERKGENEDQLERIGDLQGNLDEAKEQLSKAKKEHEGHKDDLDIEKAQKSTREDELKEKREALTQARDAEIVEDIDLSDKEVAENALEQADSAAEDARSAVQSIEEGELSNLETELQYLNRDITDKVGEIQEKWSEITDLKTEKADAEARLEDAQKRVRELESKLDEERDDIQTAASELGLPADATLDELAETHIPQKRESLSKRREEVRQKIGQLETLEEQVDELAETGQCPVCNATEEAHDIDAESVAAEHREELRGAKDELSALDDTKEALEELDGAVSDARTLRDGELDEAEQKVEELDTAVAEAETGINEKYDDLETLSKELDSLKSEEEAKEQERDDAEERLTEAREKAESAEAKEKAIQKVVDLYGEIDEIRGDIEQHEKNIENLRKLRRQAHKRVTELEDEVDELEEELGDLDADELRSEIEEIEGYIEEFESDKEDAEGRLEDVKEEIVEHQQTKKQVQQEKERKAMLQEQIAWAGDLVEEAKEVKSTYKEVRGKLRKRNLAKLNKYTNEMFSDLYQSQSYRGVQIDKKYNIHLVAADGELLEPELSSGGESTILNLALRAGVYRIIAQRDGVAGAALPPFILDEPTTFLDEDHVGELQTMIDTISDWDVPQVLVVSHNEHLIENSDNAIQVEKNPATETSRVIRPDREEVVA